LRGAVVWAVAIWISGLPFLGSTVNPPKSPFPKGDFFFRFDRQVGWAKLHLPHENTPLSSVPFRSFSFQSVGGQEVIIPCTVTQNLKGAFMGRLHEHLISRSYMSIRGKQIALKFNASINYSANGGGTAGVTNLTGVTQ